jgi:hypothetical protein
MDAMNSTLRLVDRSFRILGIVSLVTLAITIVMRMNGMEGWRTPFYIAHLAALFALLPLGIVLVVQAYRETGSVGAMIARHSTVAAAIAVIAVCVVVTQVTFTAYPDIRRASNYVTVGIIALLVIHYFRWFGRQRAR